MVVCPTFAMSIEKHLIAVFEKHKSKLKLKSNNRPGLNMSDRSDPVLNNRSG